MDSTLAFPLDIQFVADHLVVIDGFSDPAVRLMDPEAGSTLSTYGAKGEGPGEFQVPWSAAIGLGHDDFWVVDPTSQRLTRLRIPEVLSSEPFQPEMRSFRGPHTTSVSMIDERVWFGAGWITDGMVGRYEDDAFVEASAPIPPGGFDVALRFQQQGYESTLARHPDGDLFVSATRRGGLMYIYDENGMTVVQVETPDPFHPFFDVNHPDNSETRMVMGDGTRSGYVDVAATSGFIYGLFSGLTEGEAPDTRNFSSLVHVFDWSGKFIEAIDFGDPAVAIAVDPQDEWLYAVGHQPEPWVGSYRLTP